MNNDEQEFIKARLDTIEAMQGERRQLGDDIGKLRLEVQRFLEGIDATLYEDDDWSAEIKAAVVWIEEALYPLHEHYDSEEMEALMNKPKPRTFNKTKLKKELKKGGEIRKIIVSATQDGVPELTIRKKGNR
jgi:hypothetical protein